MRWSGTTLSCWKFTFQKKKMLKISDFFAINYYNFFSEVVAQFLLRQSKEVASNYAEWCFDIFFSSLYKKWERWKLKKNLGHLGWNGLMGEGVLPEYLNSLNPQNLPPHKLHLRVNSIVMLIRNISIHE